MLAIISYFLKSYNKPKCALLFSPVLKGDLNYFVSLPDLGKKIRHGT